MANILEKYGIKEVCDVTFYEIGSDGTPQHPVLYLDTLKVSTLEQTGEEAELRGGKGNAPLMVWDYNKDITITLEDALFSARSMAIMFGDGPDAAVEYKTNVVDANSDSTDEVYYDTTSKTWYSEDNAKMLMKTVQSVYKKKTDNDNLSVLVNTWKDPTGTSRKMINPKYYTAEGCQIVMSEGTLAVAYPKSNGSGYSYGALQDNTPYFCTFDIAIDGTVIEISANSFPGTYYVTGDTYARSQTTGKDEFFQLIIPKAKVQSENTITMEAEGDPSVFNMSLRVLRGENGELMKLVKYNLHDSYTTSGADNTNSGVKIYHNHSLTTTTSTGENATAPAAEG